MQTLAFLNQKGGVGKTSVTHHLAGALAASGAKVLLIDNDPQASLTQGILGPAEAEDLAPEATIAGVYAGSTRHPAAFLAPTWSERVDLVPGSWAAADFNRPLGDGAAAVAPADALGYLVEALAPTYDYCLIDCPPNLNALAWSALVAAPRVHVVVPTQPEDYGAQGLAPVRNFVEACASSNGRPATLGYLLTMVDRRTSVHKTYEAALREHYPEFLAAIMPRAAAYPEAVMARRPVEVHARRSVAAESMRAIAGELAARIAAAAEAAAPKRGKGVAR